MLNDTEDLSINKFNTEAPRSLCDNIGISSELVSSKLNEQSKILSSFGVCSLGTSPFNNVLWERYTMDTNGNETGVCIGINQSAVVNSLIKQGIKTACILVRYKDSVANSIPWFALNGSSPMKVFAGYQFFALKNSYPWEDEHEIRLVYTKTMEDEYKRFVLPKNCFTSVYYGKDMTAFQKQLIGQILTRNLSKIRRFPLHLIT